MRSRPSCNRQPKVEGGGAGQVYMSPELARIFEQAEKIAEKAGDSFVTVERMLLALAMAKGAAAGKALANAGVNPQSLNARDRANPQGPHCRQRLGRGQATTR